MSWKLSIPDGQRAKLVELLKAFASENPPDKVRDAVMRLAEPDYMEMLIQCIKRRLHDEDDEAATALFNSMLKSFLANEVIDAKPGSPRRLETFDPENPLSIIGRSIDRRVKRIFREKKKTAQLSVIEDGLSEPLDGTTELNKLLSNGEFADSDEDLPQAILVVEEMKAAVVKAVEELKKEADPETLVLITKRWLTAPPARWTDIEIADDIGERRGQRLLEKARAFLVNKLRATGHLDEEETGRPPSAPVGDH